MSDQDVFGNETKQTPPVGDPNTSQDNPFADQLGVILNENGEPKYKDVDTALKALNESQQYIKTLETEKVTQSQELEQARQELAKMGSIDDFVKKITPNAAQPNPDATPKEPTGLSEEKVVELLEKQMSSAKEAEVANANLNKVLAKLSETHGDKAASVVQAKAVELNTTPAALKELAKSNPVMAMTLLGGTVSSPAKPSTGTQTSTLTVDESNPRPEFKRGAARGGLGNSELMDMWKQTKEYTNKRIGLET